MIGIVQAQQAQGEWFIFKFFPLGLVGFFIFAVAMVAETNRAPFDLAEAESELTAGFHTEYSGFRWSLFFLAEYSAMIAVSSIAVTLWLGGWLRPFPNLLSGAPWDQVFSLFPGITFLLFAAICFYNTARMPKHPLFQDSNDRSRRVWRRARPDRADSVYAGRACACRRYFLVLGESCRVYVSLYLVSWHVPALPL